MNRIANPLAFALSIIFAGNAAASQDAIGIEFGGDLYRINMATGTSTFVGSTGVGSANSSALDSNGVLYVGTSPGMLYKVDPATGNAALLANLGADLRGLAFDSSDTLHAIFDGGGAGTGEDSLHKISLTTFATALIGPTGRAGIQGLAFDDNDVLYGYDVGLSSDQGTGLNVISTDNGKAVDINPNDNTTSVQFLTFAATGQLFGGGGSKHYEIDPATGGLTQISAGGYGDIRGADFLAPTSSGTAHWETYGSGVAGTNGEPTLSLTDDPVLGTTIKLGMTSSSNTTQASVIFFGLSDINVPAPWGGPLLVSPIVVLPLTLPPSGQGLILPLPNEIALCGLKARFQLAQFDPGAMFGIAASKGLLMRLGL